MFLLAVSTEGLGHGDVLSKYIESRRTGRVRHEQLVCCEHCDRFLLCTKLTITFGDISFRSDLCVILSVSDLGSWGCGIGEAAP